MIGKIWATLVGTENATNEMQGEIALNPVKTFGVNDALRDHFAPVLRGYGFKGSGRNFRRVSADVFQAVNVQSSMFGGMFAVNLGIHPLAIPDFFGQPINIKKSKEFDCEFRTRLSETGCDRWWQFGVNPHSLIEAAQSAALIFESHGLPIFNAQSAPDAPMFTMSPEQFDTEGAGPMSGFANSKARMAVMLDHPDSRLLSCGRATLPFVHKS